MPEASREAHGAIWHRHRIISIVEPDSHVLLECEVAPVLDSGSLKEFGGPVRPWLPRALLVGAVADCFLLTFKAFA